MELTPPATHAPGSPFRFQPAAPAQNPSSPPAAQAAPPPPPPPPPSSQQQQQHSQHSSPVPTHPSPQQPARRQPSSVYEYPSPAQSDSRYRAESTGRGLAVYPCPLPESAAAAAASEAALATPESQTWSAHPPERRTSHAAPNILSAEYDPFAPYHPAVSAAPYSHDLYAAPPAATAAASPLASSAASQRSSMSSAPASEILTQPSSVASYTPRMDLDVKPDYAGAAHHHHHHHHAPGMMLQSPPESHALLSSHHAHHAHAAGPYSAALDSSFYPEPSPMTAAWPKVDYAPPPSDLPPFSTLMPAYRRASAQEPLTSTPESTAPPTPQASLVRRATTSVPRTRQPRRLTTKEDANFQCQVKGCGKLFGRSYNFKAHMETHDSNREYPFPCPLKDCAKKFVRKTDLQRHHQSVHMKQRNFRCDYCSRFFARKDTLRRHMEDGCSKRFDIETVDFRPAAYPADPQSGPMRVMTHPADHQRSASYASVQYSPAAHPGGLPMPTPYLERPAYITEAGHQESVWSH